MAESTAKTGDGTELKAAGRVRSPNYPMFDLSAALEKATRFEASLGRHLVDVDSAMQALGYRSKTAHGGRAVATMVNYGLLEEVKAPGGRQVRLSQEGYDVTRILTEEDDPDRLNLIRDLALRPSIYARLVDRFQPPLPASDSPIRKYLLMDMGFNPDVVGDVIKDFRATYEFARIGEFGSASQDVVSNDGSSETNTEGTGLSSHSRIPATESSNAKVKVTTQQSAMRSFVIPLPNGREVLLQTPYDLSLADYHFVNAYLSLMKDAIVGRVSRETTGLVRTGTAVWHAADADRPVEVTGAAGDIYGRVYVKIADSSTGIPLDEITYEDE